MLTCETSMDERMSLLPVEVKNPGHRPGLLQRKKPLKAAAPNPPLAIPPQPQARPSWLFPVNLTLGEPQTTHAGPSLWQETVSSVNPVELVDELAQAYETSLHLQNTLRPLVPRTTWHQATAAAGQWIDNWPVEEMVATIMFTDIAGFTALLETHAVMEVLESLNDYFALLNRIVQQHRGDVHKFLGDGLMALFICPTDAVKAGCEIQQAVAEFNARQAAQGLWQFETRLAIATGQVVLASVGSTDRQDHTLIGRPVNLAAHLSERAAPGTVLISQSTYDGLADKNGFLTRTVPLAESEEKSTKVYETACL
jgi:adenylate cyclase